MNVEKAKERLKTILSHIVNQNSGADIHKISNLRNSASLLLDLLDEDPEMINDLEIQNMILRTERDLVVFYRDKY